MSRVNLPERDASGRLLIGCWCEDVLGYVTAADLKAGRTFSCGARRCRPPAVDPRNARLAS